MDVRVEGVVAERGVVEPGGQAGRDQRSHLGEVERNDPVVDGRPVARPRLAHERRGVAGAPGDLLQVRPRRIGVAARVHDVLEDGLLLDEGLAGELIGIVEDDGRVVAAPHRERLGLADVDDEVRRAPRIQPVRQTAHPAVLLAAVRRRGMPVGHRGEMGEGGVVVAAAVRDREAAVLIQALEPRHPRAEGEVVVDRAELRPPEPDRRPVAVVGVVAVGHERVEPVVAAGELKHQQDPVVGRGLRGEGGGGPAEEPRHDGAHADAAQAGAQRLAAGERQQVARGHRLLRSVSRAGTRVRS